MGQRLVPFQIQSEWAIYQQTFQAQLEQMSSYLARSAKAEKKRLTRINEDLAEALPNDQPLAIVGGDRKSRKAALWARVHAGKSGARPQPQPQFEEIS